MPGSIRTARILSRCLTRLTRGRGRLHADHYHRGVTHEHATVAEEEYLQSMFWLEEAGLPITGANIARAMQLSPPTVHEMIGRLENDGYVDRPRTSRSRSPADGREHAQAIVRRHRLIERFLTDVLGVPWDEVHEEAERLEHAMSPVLEERMLAAIGDATTCPHGHPFVEGARAGGAAGRRRARRDVHVLRFENEAEELLHYLKAAGLRPGLEGTLERSGRRRGGADSEEGSHVVSRSVAETVSVRADPSPPPRPPLPEQLGSRATATAADSDSELAADLAQAPVERLVRAPHRRTRAAAPSASCSRTADARAEKRRSARFRSLTGSSFGCPRPS